MTRLRRSDRIPSADLLKENKPEILANVKKLLEKIPQTRGDDWLLIIYYLHYFSSNKTVQVKFDRGITIRWEKFSNIFRSAAAETITRARRHIQRKDPELKPAPRTSKKRINAKDAYEEFYSPQAGLIDFS